MSGNDGPARRFDTSFRCYPAAVLGRGELNYSGMIILPPSALEKLTRLRIAYPMVFELHNVPQQKMTHAGVLEFIAEEKRVYLPHWMMRTLSLKAGELPQSTSFITAISDPKGMLENALRRFSTLTKGDKFQFLCKGDIFEIAVLDVKPQHQSGVDYAPPLDYAEPVLTTTTTDTGSGGPGSLVGGGRVTPFTQERSMAKRIGYSALAATGTLFFGYPIKPVKAGGDKEAEEKKPSMFSSGGGQTLRDATNKKRKVRGYQREGNQIGLTSLNDDAIRS
ncbi:ubiquitin fusion degradation protein [Sphaerosporella brunnea]|uniref:Ubiquitin fusion degradation protein n=1 Tax=Sphaerosporella brunnea TaxID=1250544 RepID=A0A5J5EPQ1_9PEZI|nr:ubiquitin fusion degradation protein [Sphaerosporella brunnea]